MNKSLISTARWFKNYWRDLRSPSRETVRSQNGGRLVMVWAAFSAKEKSKIAVLTGKQASEYYVYTLSKFLLLFAHLYYGTNYIFQHDNVSIPTSKLTAEIFEEQQVKVKKRPARSPDLNSIKNLWSILAAKMYANGKQYYTVNELTATISSKWVSFKSESLRNLVNSMPKRCIGVIELRGNKTHY